MDVLGARNGRLDHLMPCMRRRTLSWRRHCSNPAWSENFFPFLHRYITLMGGSHHLISQAGWNRCNISLSLFELLVSSVQKQAGWSVFLVLYPGQHYLCVRTCVLHIVLHVFGVSSLLFTHLEHMLAYLSLFVFCLNHCLPVLARLRRESLKESLRLSSHTGLMRVLPGHPWQIP